MNNRILLLITFMILAGLSCGCLTPGLVGSPPATTPAPVPMQVQPLSLSINATPFRYNPAMSSTIGIRLTPVNTSGVIPPDARFTWETPYGSFYHWGPPDFKVTELGPRYTGTDKPVYWSYFSEHGENYRRPVNITLTVWSSTDRIILTNASLRIGWEDPVGFTALVENSG